MADSGPLEAPPILSTPAEHVFEDPTPEIAPQERIPAPSSQDELERIYEVRRTASEIKKGGWKRIGLQFPDAMLRDAGSVVEALSRTLHEESLLHVVPSPESIDASGGTTVHSSSQRPSQQLGERIYVLADTSYSACCVDEIAAEHANVQVVVHYGRSCLSPTSRLPVIYVFTQQLLDLDATLAAFEAQFPEPATTKVVIMADVTYQDHVAPLTSRLSARGYRYILRTTVVHNPAGVIPNRKLSAADLDPATSDPVSDSNNELEVDLAEYSLFHIAPPPPALLLALHSRFASLHVFPATPSAPAPQTEDPTRMTGALLRRRFARVLTLSSAGVVGILVNTLSVANYLSSIDLLRRRIADAGKKSYTIVVGKLNPAKLANFAEVDGWVVVGCWESGLIEEDAGFYRPVITPFELEVALQPESERIWGLEWWGGIEKLQIRDAEHHRGRDTWETGSSTATGDSAETDADADVDVDVEGGVEGEESAPPEFDLRTGRLISHSRPMRVAINGHLRKKEEEQGGRGEGEGSASWRGSEALVKRAAGDVATINGVVSPGAEYLRTQRTWQGLGTDFDADESSTVIEEGRSGVARGYTIGQDNARS